MLSANWLAGRLRGTLAEIFNMKKQFVLILFFLTINTSVCAESFDIGGNQIILPTPEGYVQVTQEMDAVHRLSMQMTDPMNDLLAYYISESVASIAMDGELPPLERTFMVKVNKELKGMIVSSQDFAEIKIMTKRQNNEALESVKSQMPEMMDKSSKGISKEFDINFALQVTNMIPLDSHYESDNAFSYSMYINYGVSAEGLKEESVMVVTSTFINVSGKIIFLYCYGPQSDLEWTRNAIKSWTERVLSSNDQPPTQSSGGINWDKVIEKGIVGAIIGGLIGLVLSLISLFKKKKNG